MKKINATYDLEYAEGVTTGVRVFGYNADGVGFMVILSDSEAREFYSELGTWVNP